MHTRASLFAVLLLLLFARAEAAPRITEHPDRIIVELRGTPETPAPLVTAPPSNEPYLVERFVEYPDHYEVELIGRPDRGKHNPEEEPAASYPTAFSSQVAAESLPSASPRDSGTPSELASSPYYRELSDRIRTLQRERQESLKSAPGESREERELKRREADEKFREIRAVSAEMAQLRSQGGS